MSPTVSAKRVSDPVRSLDTIRPAQAKAGLRSEPVGPASDHIGLAIGSVVKDAVIGHYGSVKAAAISLRTDPSLMMREFSEGKFGRLFAHADDEAKAVVAAAIHEAYGRLTDPKTRARQSCDRMQALVNEFRQFVEVA